MLNKILAASLISLSSFLYFYHSQNFGKQEDNKILWSSQRKLIWSDFIGSPDSTKTNYGAVTTGTVEITESYWDKDVPKFKVGAYFIKSESWTVVNDEYSLSHEQLHFDIHELFARKMRKSFDSLNYKRIKDVEVYQQKFSQLSNDDAVLQRLYDSQVYFADKKAQEQWGKRIKMELLRLKKYE